MAYLADTEGLLIYVEHTNTKLVTWIQKHSKLQLNNKQSDSDKPSYYVQQLTPATDNEWYDVPNNVIVIIMQHNAIPGIFEKLDNSVAAALIMGYVSQSGVTSGVYYTICFPDGHVNARFNYRAIIPKNFNLDSIACVAYLVTHSTMNDDNYHYCPNVQFTTDESATLAHYIPITNGFLCKRNIDISNVVIQQVTQPTLLLQSSSEPKISATVPVVNVNNDESTQQRKDDTRALNTQPIDNSMSTFTPIVPANSMASIVERCDVGIDSRFCHQASMSQSVGNMDLDNVERRIRIALDVFNALPYEHQVDLSKALSEAAIKLLNL